MFSRLREWLIYAQGVLLIVVLGIGIPALLLHQLPLLVGQPAGPLA